MGAGWAAWQRWRGSTVGEVLSGLTVTVVLVAAAYWEAHPTNPRDQVLNGHPVPHTPTVALLLVAAGAGVLVVRRRRPEVVLAASTACVAAYSLLGYVNGAALLAPVIALYGVARTVSARRAVLWAVALLAVLLVATGVGNPFGVTGGGFDLIPGLVGVAAVSGIAVSSRQAYVRSVQARAEEDARRQVDEERLRIARELHDVVAHTMATINVQASVASHLVAERPEAAGEALSVIRTVSKQGLQELRAILQVLRRADEGDPVEPSPGVAQLGALLDATTAAGLPITLDTAGTPHPLPAAVDLAAYRIVQESLTNVIRHAGPATARVCLTYGPSELRVEIEDTGRGGPAAAVGPGAGGHGLVGMRERAASVGGVLEAGRGPAGGYRVVARHPLVGRAGAGEEQGAGAGVPAATAGQPAAGAGGGGGAAGPGAAVAP